MKHKIDVRNLEWYFYTSNTEVWKPVTTTLRANNEDATIVSLDIGTTLMTNLFMVPVHMLKVFLSDKSLSDYTLYAKEKEIACGFHVPTDIARFVLANEFDKDHPTYEDLVKKALEAKWRGDGKKAVVIASLKEEVANRKHFRTFTLLRLVEKYDKKALTPADLIGFDRWAYDYVEGSYHIVIIKRKGNFYFRIILWPKPKITSRKKVA